MQNSALGVECETEASLGRTAPPTVGGNVRGSLYRRQNKQSLGSALAGSFSWKKKKTVQQCASCDMWICTFDYSPGSYERFKQEHGSYLCWGTPFSRKTPLVGLKPASLCKHSRRKAEGAKPQGYSELWNPLRYCCVLGQRAESLGGITWGVQMESSSVQCSLHASLLRKTKQANGYQKPKGLMYCPYATFSLPFEENRWLVAVTHRLMLRSPNLD